jgi:rhomboid protease GluP
LASTVKECYRRHQAATNQEATNMLAPSPSPRPAFMYMMILAVNVGVYLLQLAQGEAGMNSLEQMLRWGANVAPLTLTGDPRRLFTSMFLHAGLLHLALNMYMLYGVGAVAERTFGSVRFTLIYLLAGLFGGLLSALWYADRSAQLVVSVGASGALMGIAGACLAHWCVVDRKGQSQEALAMRGPLLQTIGLTLAMGFFLPVVDNAAHVGGVVAGAVLGALFALAGMLRHVGARALAGLAICGAALVVLAIGVGGTPSPALLELKSDLMVQLMLQSRQ